jgi:hypothetical protein
MNRADQPGFPLTMSLHVFHRQLTTKLVDAQGDASISSQSLCLHAIPHHQLNCNNPLLSLWTLTSAARAARGPQRAVLQWESTRRGASSLSKCTTTSSSRRRAFYSRGERGEQKLLLPLPPPLPRCVVGLYLLDVELITVHSQNNLPSTPRLPSPPPPPPIECTHAARSNRSCLPLHYQHDVLPEGPTPLPVVESEENAVNTEERAERDTPSLPLLPQVTRVAKPSVP